MSSVELRALAARLGVEGEEALPGCLATVRRMEGLLREEAHRNMADESIFQKLLYILRNASCEIGVACKGTSSPAHLDSCLLLLTECFRCLRNACVQSVDNQNMMRNLGLIDASVHLVLLLQKLETDLESLLTALRCSLQYLGNMATGNRDSQERIWKLAFPSVFLNCLNTHDEKIIAYCCMVLLTCLNPERMLELQEGNNLNIALAVLQAFRRYPESEWVIMLLELILSQINDEKFIISEEITTFLASCFEEKCQAVLRLASATNHEDEEALVTIRLLDVLCEMTSNPEQLECLQAYANLLEVAINTLKLTHIAGKQATNIFTVTHSASGKEEISHPAMGFKSHLIRLIGNLCYKNKVNQDKGQRTHFTANHQVLRKGCMIMCETHTTDSIYELDGIPLILDNCSIDDNNPFISQWAVYTIHNLTELNERNQELIAQMEQCGLADNSVLESMGLKVERQDQRLILRSVRKMPNL
ncbi:ataxin-10 isoform X2 [Tiliqua scincoides]|uniref:ataxin-10 isoform X2 n=1 Tax=Tiliqua scincoides TaxID=71010 RepID=UPI0034619CAD